MGIFFNGLATQKTHRGGDSNRHWLRKPVSLGLWLFRSPRAGQVFDFWVSHSSAQAVRGSVLGGGPWQCSGLMR